ncbi:hypothetical protein [Ralstonia phage RP13]|nr:hypothetical protein [Ralstonia phage RP13]
MDNSQIHLLDIWESDSAHGFKIIDEALAGSEVDGKYILARVEGPAFFPNTTSKNKVFYPLEAWELAINEPSFVQRLEGRLVYGTIGHDIEINDDTVREGKLSHIVTKVWIGEDNVGRAEYLILNTPPGQILNTLLRAGSRIRVSTKAGGLFEPNVKNGIKVVKPDAFRLERIDFVIEPGYMQALPELLESLNTDVTSHKDYPMDTKVVDILEARITELKGEKDISESAAKKLTDDLMTIKESLATAQSELAHYKAHGTAVAISESLSELNQYRAIGSVQDIHEALETGEETIDTLTDTVDTMKKELEERPPVTEDEGAAAYQELGSPEEIKTALTQAIELTDELQEYRDLGTVEEIQQVLDNADTMTETLESRDREALCDKHGVSPEVLATLSEKGLTLGECDELLGSIKGTAPGAITEDGETDEERAAREAAEKEAAEKAAAEEEEERKRKEAEAAASQEVSESLSSRLIRQHNRGQKEKINESAGGQSTVAKSVLSRSARLMTLGRK